MGMHNEDTLGAVIGLIVLLIFGGVAIAKCSGSDHRTAETEFRSWAKALNIKYEGASCNNYDSDGDGYVSCTYAVNGEPHTVECAGSWNMQHGCRTPKAVLRSTTNVYNSSSSRR